MKCCFKQHKSDIKTCISQRLNTSKQKVKTTAVHHVRVSGTHGCGLCHMLCAIWYCTKCLKSLVTTCATSPTNHPSGGWVQDPYSENICTSKVSLYETLQSCCLVPDVAHWQKPLWGKQKLWKRLTDCGSGPWRSCFWTWGKGQWKRDWWMPRRDPLPPNYDYKIWGAERGESEGSEVREDLWSKQNCD